MNIDLSFKLQTAIAYMEEHILEDINYSDVAAHVYMSEAAFHRFFTAVTDMTAMEYIRNRKLSLAGQEIVLTDSKIIDIAYRYGYETPESFTKAFTRYHGISPMAARKSGKGLKAFAPLSLKVITDGGEYTYEVIKNSGFHLLAKTCNMAEIACWDDTWKQYLNFWQESVTDGSIESIKNITNSNQIYSVKIPRKDSSYLYGIGMMYEHIEEPIPQGYEVIDIPFCHWAVFQCIGRNNDCINYMRRNIFDKYLPSSAFSTAIEGEFYLYKQIHEVPLFGELWIPIVKRDDQDKIKTGSNTTENNSIKQVHLEAVRQKELWNCILNLASELDKSEIKYHFDGSTLIFAHGIDIEISHIGLTFKWNEEMKIKEFFNAANSDTVNYDFVHFKYFDAQYKGHPVRCMFYGESGVEVTDEELQCNAEPVNVDGQIIMVQTLEFYLKYVEDRKNYFSKIKNI